MDGWGCNFRRGLRLDHWQARLLAGATGQNHKEYQPEMACAGQCAGHSKRKQIGNVWWDTRLSVPPCSSMHSLATLRPTPEPLMGPVLLAELW